MVRIILGVVAGFFGWLILWVVSEQLISAVWPVFGAHQAAFQAAIENGGPFTANPTILIVHILLAAIVSAIAGFLAALVAGENRRAPLVAGLLLTAMGVLKVVMSWALVPIWYHVAFTAILLPMTFAGGKISKGNTPS